MYKRQELSRQALGCNFTWEKWNFDGSFIIETRTFTVICGNFVNDEITFGKPYTSTLTRLCNIVTNPRAVARGLSVCSTTDFAIFALDTGIRKHYLEPLLNSEIVIDSWEMCGTDLSRFTVDSKTNGFAESIGQRNRRDRIYTVNTRLWRATKGKEVAESSIRKNKSLHPEDTFLELTSEEGTLFGEKSERSSYEDAISHTNFTLQLNEEGKIISPHYLLRCNISVE